MSEYIQNSSLLLLGIRRFRLGTNERIQMLVWNGNFVLFGGGLNEFLRLRDSVLADQPPRGFGDEPAGANQERSKAHAPSVNLPPVGEENESGDGERDLQVPPVGHQVRPERRQHVPQGEEHLADRAGEQPFGRAHHLHSWGSGCVTKVWRAGKNCKSLLTDHVGDEEDAGGGRADDGARQGESPKFRRYRRQQPENHLRYQRNEKDDFPSKPAKTSQMNLSTCRL